MRSVHIDYASGVITRQLGSPADAVAGASTGSLAVTAEDGLGAAAGTRTAPGEEFTPDTIIATTDNPQTVINANPNVGHVFQFAAGTHNLAAFTNGLTPSADDQVFQGVTNGTPVTVTPTDPNGASLGKTKTLWSAGAPTSILDGGGTAGGFMYDAVEPVDWTGIRIRRLKFQNFVPGSAAGRGVIGSRYSESWIVEQNWILGGHLGVKLGDMMIVRNNRFEGQLIWWIQGYQRNGTALNPIIIADNDVLNINDPEFGAGNVVGDPQWDAGFKISGGTPASTYGQHVHILRNYIRNVHGPAIWFDSAGSGVNILDNITVDCGLNDGGGNDMAHIFYEITDSHLGAEVDHNWCLGRAAMIRTTKAHGSLATPNQFRFNTVDCDDGLGMGIHIEDNDAAGNAVGGDSTLSPAHPVINTIGIGTGRHFADHIIIEDNVIRKRNASFNAAIPLAGSASAGVDSDLARNYQWNRNKYEVNAAVTNGFKWTGGNMSFAAWQAMRAAANDSQNTGPFFDVDGEYVTWNGSKQFADTTCGWENG